MEISEAYFSEIRQRFPLDYIKELAGKFQKLKVMVLGDTILDEYVFVQPKGRAIKDPILSTEYLNKEIYAGGILAIANHAAGFSESLSVVTLIGDQEPQLDLIKSSLAAGVKLKAFVKPGSPTTIKRRYIDQYKNNKLFKVEHIDESPISPQLSSEIVAYLNEELPRQDLVLVGDFGHGFINAEIRQALQEKAKFLAVMCQSNSANMGYNYFTQYQKPHFLILNEHELRLPVGKRFEPMEQVTKDVQNLGYDNILVTLGKKGCMYARGNQICSSPVATAKVKDTVGAGDAVFAIGSLFAQIQADPELLPFIANCAGGIAANIMGNKEAVSPSRLFEFIGELYAQNEGQQVQQYFSTVSDTLSHLNKGSVSQFTKLLLDTYQAGGTIYVFGNGGSAATASHFCGDLVKGVSYGLEKRFRAICLNDNLPALMAIANDISYDDIFFEQLKNFLCSGDLVVGISGSGNSRNVVKALEYAKEKGVKTIAICGYEGGKIKEVADLSIHAQVQDMEISEDVHNLVIVHCVKQMLTKELMNNNVGEEYKRRVG